MKIQFPILNISLNSLNVQSLEEIHIGDVWDYPRDNVFFQNGHIFKIIGKIKSNFINTIIHFNKDQLKFEDTGRIIEFADLKSLVIHRYSTLDNDFDKSILIDLATKSKTFKELIG